LVEVRIKTSANKLNGSENSKSTALKADKGT